MKRRYAQDEVFIREIGNRLVVMGRYECLKQIHRFLTRGHLHFNTLKDQHNPGAWSASYVRPQATVAVPGVEVSQPVVSA